MQNSEDAIDVIELQITGTLFINRSNNYLLKVDDNFCLLLGNGKIYLDEITANELISKGLPIVQTPASST